MSKLRIIRAQFTGSDSLGYVNGREYFLYITSGNSVGTIGIHKLNIKTLNPETGSYCLYQNILSFLANWDHIENWADVKPLPEP